MATHTFQIIVTQSGAQQTAQAISQVGVSAKKAVNALALFRQALVVASTIRAATGFINLVDAATRLDNRLRVATSSMEEFSRAQNFVSQISRDTRSDLEANAVTYSRLIRATDSLGLSSEYLEKVMKGLTLATAVGGATSQEARNAMIQFSQALASGALRGDELRSVAEQIPALANAIGKEFGITGGQLIAFAKLNPGILETERVIKAVADSVPQLQEEFNRTIPTIEQGFVMLRNSAIEFFRDVNNGIGIFRAFNIALVSVADNFGLVLTAATGLVALRLSSVFLRWGAAIATGAGNLSAFISLVSQGHGVIASFSALISVNPLTIWIASIAAATVALVALYQAFPQVRFAIDRLFEGFMALVSTILSVVDVVRSSLPDWFSFYNVMGVVADVIAIMLIAFQNFIAFALVPAVVAIEAVVRALNALNLVSDSVVGNVERMRIQLLGYAQGTLEGKQATDEVSGSMGALDTTAKSLLGTLVKQDTVTKSLTKENKKLSNSVKETTDSYTEFDRVVQRTSFGVSTITRSIEGFGIIASDTSEETKKMAKTIREVSDASDMADTSISNVNTSLTQFLGIDGAVYNGLNGIANGYDKIANAAVRAAQASVIASNAMGRSANSEGLRDFNLGGSNGPAAFSSSSDSRFFGGRPVVERPNFQFDPTIGAWVAADRQFGGFSRSRGPTPAEIAFAAFKSATEGASAPVGLDFQTLTPFQGGGTRPTNDRFGLHEPTNVSNSVDNSIKVNMTVVTNDAQSFRQNRALIEDNMLSMVERAKRRRAR